MTITYKISNAKDCFDRIIKLFDEHYNELSVTKEYDLNPCYEVYFEADKRNLVQVVLCENDDELIGYIVFFLAPSLHYKDCMQATEDIYYLKPQYRKGTIGIKMFKFAEKHLKSIGINMIRYSTKTHMDNTKLFEYLGYEFIEKVFIKKII
jgi:GNAT superfamily N-acetyltransferase